MNTLWMICIMTSHMMSAVVDELFCSQPTTTKTTLLNYALMRFDDIIERSRSALLFTIK